MGFRFCGLDGVSIIWVCGGLVDLVGFVLGLVVSGLVSRVVMCGLLVGCCWVVGV